MCMNPMGQRWLVVTYQEEKPKTKVNCTMIWVWWWQEGEKVFHEEQEIQQVSKWSLALLQS